MARTNTAIKDIGEGLKKSKILMFWIRKEHTVSAVIFYISNEDSHFTVTWASHKCLIELFNFMLYSPYKIKEERNSPTLP